LSGGFALRYRRERDTVDQGAASLVVRNLAFCSHGLKLAGIGTRPLDLLRQKWNISTDVEVF
jgi:hypothetical protein